MAIILPTEMWTRLYESERDVNALKDLEEWRGR